ncbi:hypothetical protein PG997_008566 [Apiospora hydei]|uniref:Uncharacterized protein n=1 Tax=Apiospora hydei TaxID=1337664 RepID=A0ABR1WF72_9PEZI
MAKILTNLPKIPRLQRNPGPSIAQARIIDPQDLVLSLEIPELRHGAPDLDLEAQGAVHVGVGLVHGVVALVEDLADDGRDLQGAPEAPKLVRARHNRLEGHHQGGRPFPGGCRIGAARAPGDASSGTGLCVSPLPAPSTRARPVVVVPVGLGLAARGLIIAGDAIFHHAILAAILDVDNGTDI